MKRPSSPLRHISLTAYDILLYDLMKELMSRVLFFLYLIKMIFLMSPKGGKLKLCSDLELRRDAPYIALMGEKMYREISRVHCTKLASASHGDPHKVGIAPIYGHHQAD